MSKNVGLRTEKHRKTRQDAITKSGGFQVFIFVLERVGVVLSSAELHEVFIC